MSGYSFPGATTPWQSVSGTTGLTFGPINQIESKASSQASNIASIIGDLRGQAEDYASGAIANINAAMRFSETVAGVTFVPPTFASASLRDAADSLGAPPSLSTVPSGGAASFGATMASASFSPAGGAAAPAVGDLPDFGNVTSTGTSLGAPTAPAFPSVSIRAAPQVNIRVANVPKPSPPSAPSGMGIQAGGFGGALTELQVAEIDGSEIGEALSRLRSIAGRRLTLPRPNRKFEEIFEVVGSLLSGDLVIDADALVDSANARVRAAGDAHDQSLLRLWSDRGMTAPSDGAVGAYNTAMRVASERDAAANNVAAQGRWLDDSIKAAYEVGVAAHSMMIDMEMSLYDLEFDALLKEAEARLEMTRAAVSAYNGAVALYKAKLATLGANYAMAEASASRYRGQADVVRENGRLNAAIADAFAAGEKAKQIDAQLFEAQGGANEARVKAFESEMRGLAAKAKAMQVDVERYKGSVVAWEASVESARAQYRQASNQARLVAAKNQAEAARVKASSVHNEAVAVQARAIAANTSAQAAKIRADIQQRASRYAGVEATNAIESAIPAGQAAHYEAAVSRWAATQENKAGLLEGRAAEMAAAAKFFVATSESEHRAAQLTQEWKQQLAEAHRTVSEAAARAGAAVESGRLSGYRASSAVTASGNLSAGWTHTLSASDSYSSSVRETDSKTTKVGE